MYRPRGVLIVAVTLLLALPSAAGSDPAASASHTAVLSLHLRFRLLARGVNGVVGSRSYVAYTTDTFRVLDDRTGRPLAVRWPRFCDFGAIGYPWVALDCGLRFRLYNINTGKWRVLRCRGLCHEFPYQAGVFEVGAKWLSIDVNEPGPCGDGVHYSCGPTVYLYYNIATGRPRTPQTGARAMIDLNATSLVRKVCSPLPLPPSPSAKKSQLTGFYGGFAVVQELFTNFSSLQNNGPFYLERCGTSLHLPIVPPADAGPDAGTTFGDRRVAGLCLFGPQYGFFLPSLRRFTFDLPKGTPEGCELAFLGPRHIYLFDSQRSLLWEAAFPTRPPG